MVKVAIVRCESYEEDKVRKAVKKGVALIGGWESICDSGEKILIKPNLLAPEPPERCVTTHPAVFRAVLEELLDCGVVPAYGDSPAFGSSLKAAKKSGIYDVADELGIPMADFNTGQKIAYLEGHQNKSFVIANGVLESDGMISVSKMKTHGLTTLTGAIKNQFGCIPGVLKGEFHVKLPELDHFATMLVDLNRYLRPRLYIMDAITAMEGNGPRGGTPKQMNLLLFSKDPVALDSVVCKILGIHPEEISTVRLGKELGLGESNFDEIEIAGDLLESFIPNAYHIAHPNPLLNLKSKGLRNQLVARPIIDENQCIRCGMCVQMCPVSPSAVNWDGKPGESVPSYDYKQCIRCYCCQEICPEGAIDLITPWLGRMIKRLT